MTQRARDKTTNSGKAEVGTDNELSRPPRVGVRDVAEAANVAMSSVSRVLSGHPDVSPSMRARVRAAVDELGYKPDMLAQSLRRRETMTAGFVVADISNPVVAQIVRGAEVRLREDGYTLLLANSLADPELDREHIELLRQRRADGLLVLPATEGNLGTNEALEQLDTPVVVIERNVPDSVGASKVFSDHHAGMEPAVERLLELGHRRIALIGGPAVRPAEERVEALHAVFDRLKLPPTYDVYRGSFSEDHGAAITRQLLDLAEPPTAIIAGSHQIMVGALWIIGERGVELGRQLSFVGCDDLNTARLFRPPIAVVARDLVELGELAASALLRRMTGEQAGPEVVNRPTRFIDRPSCGPVPG